MLAKVLSSTVVGLESAVVEVEVDLAPGLPAFTIVGLGDTAVQEARERVRAAIRNSGALFPIKRRDRCCTWHPGCGRHPCPGPGGQPP